MKTGVTKFSRPTGLDTKTWRSIEPIFNASQQVQRETGRFKSYGCLVAVYRTYKEWKDLKISKKMARHLAKSFRIPRRTGTSPVRTLIDATFPTLDAKQKSRWSRALEFAAFTKATPDQLPNLLKNHSGIAGCARWAAKQKPNKKTYRYDWASDIRPGEMRPSTHCTSLKTGSTRAISARASQLSSCHPWRRLADDRQ